MKQLLILLFCFSFGTSRAQLFSIIESSAKSRKVLDNNSSSIVDINGRLTVQLNRQQLISSLARSTGAAPATADKLDKLIKILENQKAIMPLLQPYSENVSVNRQQLAQLSNLMVTFLTNIKKDPAINKLVNSYYTDAFSTGYDTNRYTTLDAYVISRLSLYADSLTMQLRDIQGVSNIKVQLLAFLNTRKESDRRIHIENFDNYSEGAFLEIPRWVTSFSQDDINAFNQAASLSKGLNELVAGNFSSLLKKIPDSLNAYKCIGSLVTDFQNKLNAEAQTGSQEIKDFLNKALQDLTSVYAAIESLQQQKGDTGLNALSQFNNISSSVITLAEKLPASVNSLFNGLSTQAKSDLTEIKSAFDNCLTVLQSDVTLVKNIYGATAGLLSPFHQTASGAQQTTGDVFSFALSQLPEQGYINLKTTGSRENGDELVIKLRYSNTQNNSSATWQTVQQQVIELQQINFYSETNVGVILASPIGSNPDVTLKSKFQFAPSGNLLLKFGSRKSRFWNNLNPGIGFNISTPDFNTDGSPDISYGGVLTLLRNVLSLGLSYNTKTSSSFWFFGLSLPFSSIPLPFGGNVQTQKTGATY